jgi:Ca2+-binding RTX toxin-like protein
MTPNPVEQTINGGETDDFIISSSQNQSINGLAGNDTLYGMGGNDNIEGGADNDSIFGNEGSDFIKATLATIPSTLARIMTLLLVAMATTF